MCRAHNTEMSKAMDTPVPAPLQWPSRSPRGGSAGGGAEKGASAGGSAGRSEQPQQAGRQALPPLGRSLLRGSHAGSADSLATSEPGGIGMCTHESGTCLESSAIFGG